MGHIQKRGDKNYLARWIDPDGRERAKKFTKKGDAEQWVIKKEAEKQAGTYVDLSNTTTVLEYARQWAAMRPHRATTAARTKAYIDHHVAATKIANRKLSALLPSEVQSWATDRSKILAPITVRLLVSMLRSIMTSAVVDNLATKNPVVNIKLPKVAKRRIVPLTVEQVIHLADAMPDRCRAMAVVQAGLGLRVGELLGLRIRDVDFLHRVVRVRGQLSRDGREFLPRKNAEDGTEEDDDKAHVVPLPQVVAEALAGHIAAYPAHSESGLLFTSSTGRPYRQSHYGAQIFPAAVRRAGLPADITTHSLRHHYASVLLYAGESVVAVAERLGDTPAMVLRVYGHLMPDSEDRTRRAIDTAWTPEQETTNRTQHR